VPKKKSQKKQKQILLKNKKFLKTQMSGGKPTKQSWAWTSLDSPE